MWPAHDLSPNSTFSINLNDNYLQKINFCVVYQTRLKSLYKLQYSFFDKINSKYYKNVSTINKSSKKTLFYLPINFYKI